MRHWSDLETECVMKDPGRELLGLGLVAQVSYEHEDHSETELVEDGLG